MARDRIFAAIRKANGPVGATDQIAREARALVEDRAAVQPGFPEPSLKARFIAKATSERVTAKVVEIDGLDPLPQAVEAYCKAAGLPPDLALQPNPELLALDWDGLRIHHKAAPDEAVALTMAEYAIAETGSVVTRSGPDAPTLLNYLPLHHLVAVRGARILPYLEDLWDALGRDDVASARSLNIITGTSGTADIEAKNIRGAHGPKHMAIFLV